jgi:FXSXX-COOH protein
MDYDKSAPQPPNYPEQAQPAANGQLGSWMTLDASSNDDLALPDLSDLSLAAVDSLPDTVLSAALRRILGAADGVGDRYCGFESSLP